MEEDFSLTFKVFGTISIVFAMVVYLSCLFCGIDLTMDSGNSYVGFTTITKSVKERITSRYDKYEDTISSPSMGENIIESYIDRNVNAGTYIEDNSIVNKAESISYQPFLIVSVILLFILCVIYMILKHIKDTREYTERLLNINLNGDNDELLNKYK